MAGSYALYRCAVLSTSSGSLSGILDRDSPIQILHLNVFMEQQEFADGLEISNEEYCNWRAPRAFGQRCFYNTTVV